MSLGTKTIQGLGDKAVDALREEIAEQGHTLTGALEASIQADIANGTSLTLDILANDYSMYVNDGFSAKSASMKQFPFVFEYWRKRGLSEKEARGAAAATIRKWQKEGMPTQSSKAHSKNGRRTKAIEEALDGNTSLEQNLFDGLSDELDDLFEMDKDVII